MNQEKNKEKDNGKINRLIDEMEKVTLSMKKHYSLKTAFLRGILYGLGFVLGTTIVAGILLTMANSIFPDIPFQQAIENKISGK